EINVAPGLLGQGNQTLFGQQRLIVTNTASEPDMPPVTLAYQLTGPAGAVIDANGIISWTPSVAQVPSTNVFTTVVTDSNPWSVNNQQLSATNSFTVIVLPVFGPVLPGQTNRTVNELAALVVTNTATDANPTVPQISTNTVLFNYTDRTA